MMKFKESKSIYLQIADRIMDELWTRFFMTHTRRKNEYRP